MTFFIAFLCAAVGAALGLLTVLWGLDKIITRSFDDRGR